MSVSNRTLYIIAVSTVVFSSVIYFGVNPLAKVTLDIPIRNEILQSFWLFTIVSFAVSAGLITAMTNRLITKGTCERLVQVCWLASLAVGLFPVYETILQHPDLTSGIVFYIGAQLLIGLPWIVWVPLAFELTNREMKAQASKEQSGITSPTDNASS